ncbi:hypothetical protein NPIL_17381 [Nephila pilipes]|uniref:Uncharacterized protein n=1 Tax=Nephila pilipes TaxID=299642 RepID=A0A8X6TGR3_NEPPI|nr:hypothetical protein NPIL_120681 [Nephila pilipes]GFT11598.1 hypothetical protein NPIL_452341 [Nephila pilipes]GFT50288.1 hypothetical protein NPIL_37001 [Nephila pilipes]GFT76112.1 hypothetical protein NPIL_17381 [Nephila pilipes]
MKDVIYEVEPEVWRYRPEKTTKKNRVVFNAASETTNGALLNSLQINGGVVQDDLISILMRFRKHPFACLHCGHTKNV